MTTEPSLEGMSPKPNRQCPECGARFHTTHSGKEFCSPAHRVAFGNRLAMRGKVLTPIAMAQRQKRARKGTIGAQCVSEFNKLVAQFTKEDQEAGRPPMHQYTDRLLNHSINLRKAKRHETG